MENTNWPVYSLRELLQRLPGAAQQKYRALCNLIEDCSALIEVGHERAKALNHQVEILQDRQLRLDDADDKSRVREQIETLRADLDKVALDSGKHTALRANSQQVKAAIDSWLGQREVDNTIVGQGALRAVKLDGKPKAGEAIDDGIRRLRKDIMQLKSERARIIAAPLPAKDIKAAIVKQVEALAARGRPQLTLDGGKVEISFADMPMFGSGAKTAPAGSASAMLAWLYSDQIIKALTAGLDSIEGIGSKERTQRLATIDQQLLAAEHEEETLVTLALSKGMEVHRRLGVNVLAVLGIEVVAVAELVAAE